MELLKKSFFVSVFVLQSLLVFSQTENGGLENFCVEPALFADSCNVCFSVTAQDTVDLKVYDMYGGIDTVFLNYQAVTSGEYHFSFAPENNGRYFVNLQLDDSVYSKVVVKDTSVNVLLPEKRYKLLVYPVPADDFLRLSFSYKPERISVINEAGKIFYFDNNVPENLALDVSDFKSGVYFVFAGYKYNVVVKKIIIEH
jgi:hypothetical protein